MTEISGIYKPTQADKKALKRIANRRRGTHFVSSSLAHAWETLAYLKLAASDFGGSGIFLSKCSRLDSNSNPLGTKSMCHHADNVRNETGEK
mmetsp:Transcript_26961/g.48781  ORF Transcript_26961/g.48781 Transcript_26961/m.48781 type:complete len:92 (+) Transcript_26961:100-375(+)